MTVMNDVKIYIDPAPYDIYTGDIYPDEYIFEPDEMDCE